ncbi:MAG: hypothetical protein K9J16_06320 [Melioribacteraceae bacterium]|nr:hypothetical protein [Melioribacteraceae bacterium]MCF8356973.1 hypothetical protein [Melioribacteraceae bacterium]MCF8394119.1 hypothetical protein [Melioribacteraceae bacterium]MCF8418143.1 hypothetical protein [Melioribacteraceae bacterium]
MNPFTFILDLPFEINRAKLIDNNKSLQTALKRTQTLPGSTRLVLRNDYKLYTTANIGTNWKAVGRIVIEPG